MLLLQASVVVVTKTKSKTTNNRFRQIQNEIKYIGYLILDKKNRKLEMWPWQIEGLKWMTKYIKMM